MHLKPRTSAALANPSRRQALTMGGAAMAVGPGLPGQASAMPNHGVRRVLDAAVERGDVPGLVALIGRGDDVWTHVAGVRDL